MKNKSIKSQDGECEIRNEEIENVCICVVIYALLIYLLSHKLETIQKHTIYFFDEGVAQSIRRKLPSVYIRSRYPQTLRYKFLRKFIRLWTALTRNIKYPFMKRAAIYAQDGTYPSMLIGNKQYALLSDSPNFFTMNAHLGTPYMDIYTKKSKSIIGRLEKIIYGAPFVFNFGNNCQCTQIYLTEENDSPLLEGKDVIVHSIKELWDSSEDEKKQFVLNLFDITNEDISLMNEYPIFFFTQPLVEDSILTEKEYDEVLTKILGNYDLQKILIKTHPRDKYDYKKHYPNVAIFDKPVNVQFLSLLDLSFKKAITIFSTAVFELPESVEVDWFGGELHPKIKKIVSDNCIPPRPYNQMHI